MNLSQLQREQNKIELEELHRFNWEEVLNLKLSEEQTKFVPPILYSIAQSRFEKNSKLYAIKYNDKVIGFLMLLVNPPVCWISRIIIDEKYQNLGIGTKIIRQIIEEFSRKKRFSVIKAAVDKNNKVAQNFFHSLGFEPVEVIDDEVIFELDV